MAKIVITTGGTGGHVFPAIAVAKRVGKHEVLILVDKRGAKYLKDSGLNFKIIHSSQLYKDMRLIKALFLNFVGFLQAILILIKFRADLVFGFGSYSSMPVLTAGKILGKKIMIHEQNSVFGRVNGIFAKIANGVCVSFENLVSHSKKNIFYTGNPVREEIKKLAFIERTWDGKSFNILITGGSGGASIFDERIPQAISEIGGKFNIYHQVREDMVDLLAKEYKKFGIEAIVASFFQDMENYLQKADLVISRAGSTSISEILVAGKPAILVPIKNSVNNHQYYNAKFVSDKSAAVIMEEKDFTRENIANQVRDLMQNPKKLQEMSSIARSIANLNADIYIMDIVENILNQKSANDKK